MTKETAIVTGASSGIGKATALLLASQGCNLGITYSSNREGAEKTAQKASELGAEVAIRQMEQTDPSDVEAKLNEVFDELGGVDIFVNNAGTLGLTDFVETELDEWRRVVDCNLTGAFVAGRTVARRMIADGTPGRIVNVSSVHEAVPLMSGAAYCASKGGVGMLTKCMALDLAPKGIRVNAIGPGETATPMSGAVEGEDVHARKRPEVPAGRPAKPEEIAQAIAYLVSEEAASTIGTTLFVDGGLLLMSAIGNQRTIMASLSGED